MKFTGQGNQIVWDAQKGRELCRFTKGEFETEDPRTCKILIGLGYSYEGDAPLQAWLDESPAGPPTDPPVVDEELEKLRTQAKELKIRNWHTMKREGLEKAIAAVLAKSE